MLRGNARALMMPASLVFIDARPKETGMRSHYCGEINTSHLDRAVELCGWVHHRRDHGGVIFIDLRDREGIVQVVVDPDTPQCFELAGRARHEYVLRVEGRVRHRPEGTVNPDLPTGEVEVVAQTMEILNAADTPPLQIDDEQAHEDVRLRYRYIDLRRPRMQHNLRLRARVCQRMRRFLDEHGFIETETPVLTRSTPEGARDYLVPSRTHLGKFFALPQSPQLFKQLLMMSGFDRYYQIVRCFRDEDLRADRQPEFTQLDIEMSFMDEQAITQLMENMVRYLFRECIGIELPGPFPRMDYAQAMSRFGSDRPDLRNPLELIELSDLMTDVEFKVFSAPAGSKTGRVAALRAPGAGRLTRKNIDDYAEYVALFGAKGLAYIKVNDRLAGRDGLQSPILKFLPDDVIAGVMARTGAQTGDLVFFGADRTRVVNESLGALRLKLGQDLGLIEEGFRPAWIEDFPMFEWNETEGRYDPLHHPFTAPKVASIAELESDPASCLSKAYDLVLNGTELGGGSVRIHRPEMQEAVLRLLGIDQQQAREKFGFLIDALKYGCPPHGGIAFGLDRMVMMMCGAQSIRDVIAFPKTQTAACPLTSAPTAVAPAQLRELGIRLSKQPAS